MDDPIFSQPMRIEGVNIVGLNRTRRNVVESELAGALKGRTVREVSSGIMHALKNLKGCDSFDRVEVHCDVSTSPLQAAEPDMQLTDVTIRIKEKRVVQLKAETYVQGQGTEGGVETSLSLNNALGATEKLNVAVSYGSKSSAAGRVQFLKPKFRGLPLLLDVTASHSTVSRALFSSYDEKVQALRASLRSNNGRHELGAGTSWRDVIPLRSEHSAFEYAASGLIIAQAVPTLKNSVHYTFTADGRDSPYGPTQGSLLQVRSELAGMGGDVKFAKAELQLQQHVPLVALQRLVPGITLGLSFIYGLLCPLERLHSRFSVESTGDRGAGVGLGAGLGAGAGPPRPAAHSGKPSASRGAVGTSTAICDRFWLGGPLGLRGFSHRGAGPRTSAKRAGARGGDALGGDVTWTAGAALSAPFPHPFMRAAGLRCQAYCNAGNLCAWETSASTLLQGARVSVGAGLVFPTAIGRVEANYSFVLRANARDQQKRFQLGLGVDFL